MENTVLHKAATRGYANHGWLKSYHSFSFADYHNAGRMNFGALRVLNDDFVEAGMGFGTHPHNNMEIISIPLEGDLEHKDSMGNVAVIRHGDVQVMSAGSGIRHSEYNHNTDKAVKFLQIWVFPNQHNVTPRYQQISLNPEERLNRLQQIVSPDANDEGTWIHQNAWFYLSKPEAGVTLGHTMKSPQNGAYLFVLSGKLEVNGHSLETRDGLGVWNTDTVVIKAIEDAEFLLMDVPMHF